jgi:prepilin-type N-terminal cleavage/methylation domain-containing protein
MRISHRRRGGPDPRRRAGFTLIEVMIAMVVMSIGLFAVIQLQVVTVRGNAYARETTEAYELAMAVAEDFRLEALKWTNPTASFDTVYYGGGVLDAILPAPVLGGDFGLGDLRAVPMLHGQPIASGAGFGDALPINIHGQTAGERAVYRVHCLAHRFQLSDFDPSALTTRVTIFVSWDNKDHGSQAVAWESAAPGVFFGRHMVSVTFFLEPVR